MISSRENLGLVLGFIGVAIFAGSLPATRIAVASLDPWFVTAARAAIAGIVALATIVVLRRPLPPRATFAPLVVIVFAIVLGFPVLSALAMTSVPAAHGGVVLGILPLATSAAAVLVAGERPSRGFWIVGALGAALVVVFALRHGGGGAFAAGDLFLLASIVTAAVGYAFSGRLAQRMPGWEVIAWVCILALPASGLSTWLLWPAHIETVPVQAWVALAFVSLFAQFIGFFAWNAGLAMGGIARVSQVQLLQPFMTIAIAPLVNGEAIDLETTLFAVAVVAIVMIGRRMPIAK